MKIGIILAHNGPGIARAETMNAMFQDDRLVSNAQFGLK